MILILLGAAWISVGIGFATIPQERFSRPGPGGILQFLDNPPYPAFVWLFGGALGLLGGLFRPWHRDDAWGFVGLAIAPFGWSLCYLWSFVASWIPGDMYGRRENWVGIVVFASIVAIVLFIARWPDPAEPWVQLDDDRRASAR